MFPGRVLKPSNLPKSIPIFSVNNDIVIDYSIHDPQNNGSFFKRFDNASVVVGNRIRLYYNGISKHLRRHGISCHSFGLSQHGNNQY